MNDGIKGSAGVLYDMRGTFQLRPIHLGLLLQYLAACLLFAIEDTVKRVWDLFKFPSISN